MWYELAEYIVNRYKCMSIINKQMLKRLILFMLFFSLLYSCSRKGVIMERDKECFLDKKKNWIIGEDKMSKLFGSEFEYFLPREIEILGFNGGYINTDYREPLRTYTEIDSVTGGIRMVNDPNAKSKLRAAYKIEGCADTVWAKKRMANHLLKKYKLTRKDSFFYNSIFNFSIHPDSIHLLTPHADTNIIIGMKNVGWYQYCMGCTFAVSIGLILEEQGYSLSGLYRYELKPLESYHDLSFLNNVQLHFVYNYKKYREMDNAEIVLALEEDFGILLTHVRTDTLKMGYYVLHE